MINFTMQLDKLDKKILYELDLDSRQSYHQIAKRVNSSKEVVAYRIKRLNENNIIFRYITVLDPAKLGYSLQKIMFKLENVDPKEREEIIHFLKNHPYSLWTAECDGPFDIGFMVFSRDSSELDRVITEISDKLSKYIHERVISTTITGEYFTRLYLLDKESKRKQTKYGEVGKKEELDNTDWQILLKLSDNSRISLVEMAKQLPIKIDAIRLRINRMEKVGIIRSYSIIVNNPQINQLHYKILIYLRDFSKQKLRSIREFCHQNPNIVYLIKSLGVWDMELDIEVDSIEKYREIMTSLLKQFPNTIKKYDAIQIYKIHQYRFLPDKSMLV